MDGVTAAIQDRIRHGYITDKWSMMFFLNLFATIVFGATLLLSGELVAFLSFVQRYPYVLREMIIFSLMSALGQVRCWLHEQTGKIELGACASLGVLHICVSLCCTDDCAS